MPLPILHGYAGYLAYRCLQGSREGGLVKPSGPAPQSSSASNSRFRYLFNRLGAFSVFRQPSSDFHSSKYSNPHPPTPIPLIFCIFLAILPDFDFIPGAMIGHAYLFHRDFSHSIFAAVIAGTFFAFLFHFLFSLTSSSSFLFSSSRRYAVTPIRRHVSRPPYPFSRLRSRVYRLRSRVSSYFLPLTSSICLFTASYASHLVLDLGNMSNKGLMLLWPFDKTIFYSPFFLFGGRIDHADVTVATGDLSDFALGLINRGALRESLYELAIIFFVWGVLTARRGWKVRMRELQIRNPALQLSHIGHFQTALVHCGLAFVFFATGVMVGIL